MKGNFKATSALALLSDSQFSTSGGNLTKLQETAIAQMDLIKRMESESALRAVLVGLALHRIKASLKYGEFGKWQAKHLAAKKSQVNYYMRLAMVCLDKGGFTKPDLLQLAEGGTDLALSDGPARRAFKKIQDFVGDMSLNELLIEHDLKNASAGGSSSSSSSATGEGEDPLLADTAQHLMGLRALLLDPETVKRFTARQLDDIEKQWASGLEQFRQIRAKMRG